MTSLNTKELSASAGVSSAEKQSSAAMITRLINLSGGSQRVGRTTNGHYHWERGCRRCAVLRRHSGSLMMIMVSSQRSPSVADVGAAVKSVHLPKACRVVCTTNPSEVKSTDETSATCLCEVITPIAYASSGAYAAQTYESYLEGVD